MRSDAESPARGAILAVFFVVALGLSWLNGAFEAEFWGPDEAAHYVTGLLAFDFLRSPTLSPLEFARTYYAHYPKVAIGHWPPFFYLVQALWMLVFSESHASMVALMALLAALAAYGTWRFWQPPLGWLGFGVALLFLALPLSQRLTSTVMAEMPLIALVLAAARSYTRYLETSAWRHSIAFGVWATLALLTKPNGMTLALVPPLAVLLSRRFDLLAKPSFYAPGMLVAGICAPWYLLNFELAEKGWRSSYTAPNLLGSVAVVHAQTLVALAGPVLLVLGAAGLLTRGFAPMWGKGERRPVWCVGAALAVATLIFHNFVAPVRESRHLLMAAPMLLGFAAQLTLDAGRRLDAVRPYRATAVLAGLALVAFFGFHFVTPPKRRYGAAKPAALIIEQSGAADTVLVSTYGADGEGAMVAEIAMRDDRLGRRVLRASQALARTDWAGQDYQLRQSDSDELVALLRAQSVSYLAVETRNPFPRPGFPHHAQVLELLRRRAELFSRLPAEPDDTTLSNIEVYRLTPARAQRADDQSSGPPQGP